jgi:plasmid stabilization system protein ParE
MTYRLIWTPAAENDLAAVWLAAADRPAVNRAADELDRVLARTPLGVGVARRSSVHRVAFFEGVGVEYEVIEDDKKVLVQAVFAVG